MAYVSNNPSLDSDYLCSLDNRLRPTSGTGNFRFGATTYGEYADMGRRGIDPFTSYAQGSTGRAYTVRGGETLSGIAAGIWDDASLWYKLASANGLDAKYDADRRADADHPGRRVALYLQRERSRPYDPGEVTGDTSPTSPVPQNLARAKEGLRRAGSNPADRRGGRDDGCNDGGGCRSSVPLLPASPVSAAPLPRSPPAQRA